MHEVSAAIPAHIDNQTFCRVLRDEFPKMFCFVLKPLIRAEIHVDSLRIRQIGKPKGRVRMLEGERNLIANHNKRTVPTGCSGAKLKCKAAAGIGFKGKLRG